MPSVCKDFYFNGTHVQAKGDRKKLLNNLATAQGSITGGGGGQDSRRGRETKGITLHKVVKVCLPEAT